MHNQTGYRPKPINAAKAVLYTMMPRGSVAMVPDSLWNDPLWASMLLGNSLRSGRVMMITPSLKGAPSSGAPQMSRGQELWERMIIAQQILGEESPGPAACSRPGSTPSTTWQWDLTTWTTAA